MLKNITTLPMKTFLFRRRDLHRADTRAIPSKKIVSCSLSGFRAEKKVDYRSTTRGPGEAEGQRTCPEVWTKVTTRRAQQESFNKRSSAIVHRCGLHFGYEHVVPHPKHLGAAIPREHMYHMRLAHEHVSLVHVDVAAANHLGSPIDLDRLDQRARAQVVQERMLIAKFCGHSKAGLLVPCALSVRRKERHASTEESLDEATNSGRLDEKRKGVVRPCVPSSSVMVWTRRLTSSRLYLW